MSALSATTEHKEAELCWPQTTERDRNTCTVFFMKSKMSNFGVFLHFSTNTSLVAFQTYKSMQDSLYFSPVDLYFNDTYNFYWFPKSSRDKLKFLKGRIYHGLEEWQWRLPSHPRSNLSHQCSTSYSSVSFHDEF